MSKTWSPEQRAKASERCLLNRPWRSSTGPRTERGKSVSSQNAYKDGRFSKDIKQLRSWLCQMAKAGKILRTAFARFETYRKIKPQKKTENELSSKSVGHYRKGRRPPHNAMLRYLYEKEIREIFLLYNQKMIALNR